MKKVFLLTSILLLSSCTSMTDLAVSAIKPDKGIEATAQVGKENTKNGVGLSYKDNSAITTDDVSGNVNVTQNTTTTIPWWFALIAAICGILVNPFTVKRLFFSKELQ